MSALRRVVPGVAIAGIALVLAVGFDLALRQTAASTEPVTVEVLQELTPDSLAEVTASRQVEQEASYRAGFESTLGMPINAIAIPTSSQLGNVEIEIDTVSGASRAASERVANDSSRTSL